MSTNKQLSLWRLLQASTKLKCVKGPCEIEDLKQRLTGTSRPHGKSDGHKRLQDGVSEDERWSLIKMVNLQVSRLQDGCSGDETRAAWATSSESSNGNSEQQRDEPAAAVPSALTRHAASMRAAATAVLPAPPG